MDGTKKKCRECLEELGISESECLEGFAKGKWRLNPVNDLKHIYGMSKKARGNIIFSKYCKQIMQLWIWKILLSDSKR